MSTCGDCNCVDKSQCVKKGNGYGIMITETEKKSFFLEKVAEVAAATEPDCKCGSNCTCDGCNCGN